MSARSSAILRAVIGLGSAGPRFRASVGSILLGRRVVTSLQVPGHGVEALTARVAADLGARAVQVPRPDAEALEFGAVFAEFRIVASPTTQAVVCITERPNRRAGAALHMYAQVRRGAATAWVLVLAVAAVAAVVGIIRAVAHWEFAPLYDVRWLIFTAAAASWAKDSMNRRLRTEAARLARP